MGSNVFSGFYMDVSRLELVSLLVQYNLRNNFLLVLRGSLSIRITGWYTEMVVMNSPETVENDEGYLPTLAEIVKDLKDKR